MDQNDDFSLIVKVSLPDGCPTPLVPKVSLWIPIIIFAKRPKTTTQIYIQNIEAPELFKVHGPECKSAEEAVGKGYMLIEKFKNDEPEAWKNVWFVNIFPQEIKFDLQNTSL